MNLGFLINLWHTYYLFQDDTTMKFITALTLSSIFAGASAFSAVAPNVGNTEPVDKSLKGIDSAESVFDPTGGDNAALIRNNNDEVWVPQVRNV